MMSSMPHEVSGLSVFPTFRKVLHPPYSAAYGLLTRPLYNNNFHLWCQNHGTAARGYKGTETYRIEMRHQTFILESVKGKKM